jgi:hypothetical protein
MGDGGNRLGAVGVVLLRADGCVDSVVMLRDGMGAWRGR